MDQYMFFAILMTYTPLSAFIVAYNNFVFNYFNYNY